MSRVKNTGIDAAINAAISAIKKLSMTKRALLTFGMVSTFIVSSLSVLAHSGHTHKAPWEACFDAEKDQACEYKNGNKDIFKGTCQLFSERLMCVRNQPIIKAESALNKSGILDQPTIDLPREVKVKLD